jgi:hypothetical protein
MANRAGDGARPRAQSVAFVAGFDDPHGLLPADDLSDVVPPDHHRADASGSAVTPMCEVASNDPA